MIKRVLLITIIIIIFFIQIVTANTVALFGIGIGQSYGGWFAGASTEIKFKNIVSLGGGLGTTLNTYTDAMPFLIGWEVFAKVYSIDAPTFNLSDCAKIYLEGGYGVSKFDPENSLKGFFALVGYSAYENKQYIDIGLGVGLIPSAPFITFNFGFGWIIDLFAK